MFSGIFRLQLILLLMLPNFILLNAANYDEDILNIYSKMLPRFIVMSSQKEKIHDDMKICILYNKLDVRIAHSLSSKIHTNYPQGLLNHPIKIVHSNYANLTSCQNTHLAFLLNSDNKSIKQALLFLQQNQILSMSYDVTLLEQGVDISLFLGRKVVPYLNMETIGNKKILLDNLLLRVSKIYVKSEQ